MVETRRAVFASGVVSVLFLRLNHGHPNIPS